MALPAARTRRLIVIAGIALAIGVFAIAIIIFRSNPDTTDLPVAIQAVEPVSGSSVPLQSDVVVDLAVGYVATIDINGLDIPPQQINEVSGLNLYRFQPGVGNVLERLFTDQNCVRVRYWLLAQGEDTAQFYTWCFQAG